MGKKKDKKNKKGQAEVHPGIVVAANGSAPKAAAEAKAKLSRKEFESELEKLQIELVKLQEWVKYSGAKVCVLFEGRDTAGKGGIIKCITERTSPRVFRVVALPYAEVPHEKIKLPKRQSIGDYIEPDYPFRRIPAKY
jgi:polyphosphate kinase 2 (PPK2 family)